MPPAFHRYSPPFLLFFFLFVAQSLSEMFLVINLSARRKQCALINAGEWMEECGCLLSLCCCPFTVFTIEKQWRGFCVFILWSSWPRSFNLHIQHYSCAHADIRHCLISLLPSEWLQFFYHLLQNSTRGQDCYEDFKFTLVALLGKEFHLTEL